MAADSLVSPGINVAIIAIIRLSANYQHFLLPFMAGNNNGPTIVIIMMIVIILIIILTLGNSACVLLEGEPKDGDLLVRDRVEETLHDPLGESQPDHNDYHDDHHHGHHDHDHDFHHYISPHQQQATFGSC